MTNLTRRSKTTLILSATILGLSASSLTLANPQSITPSRVSQAKASKSYDQSAKASLHAMRVVARFSADGLVPKLEMDVAMRGIPAGSSVALSLRGAPLRFDQLTQKRQVDLEKRFGKDASARYEAGLSSQLAELVAKIRSESSADRVGVVGMPFVPHDSDDTASNSNYTQLIGEVDVFIPRTEAGQKRQLLNALSSLARGRDIVSVDGDLLNREDRDRGARDARQEMEDVVVRVDAPSRWVMVTPAPETTTRPTSVKNRSHVFEAWTLRMRFPV